jgi:hypothetical protein
MTPDGYPQWVVAYEPRPGPDQPAADPSAPLSPGQ